LRPGRNVNLLGVVTGLRRLPDGGHGGLHCRAEVRQTLPWSLMKRWPSCPATVQVSAAANPKHSIPPVNGAGAGR